MTTATDITVPTGVEPPATDLDGTTTADAALAALEFELKWTLPEEAKTATARLKEATERNNPAEQAAAVQLSRALLATYGERR